MHIFEDINVDNNTYIVDGKEELQLADVSKRKGFWLLGYDRDGTCFEMCKIDSEHFAVKDILQDSELEVYEHGDCTYYWTENIHDSSILFVH